MFSQQDVPENWSIKKLGDICRVINGDRGSEYPNSSDLVEEGIPFIKIGHINGKEINWKEVDYITQEKFSKLSRGKLQHNDIIMCIRGSVGKFAVFRETSEYKTGFIRSTSSILRPENTVTHSYFRNYLHSPYFQRQAQELATGSTHPNLSANNLKRINIPVPPLNEQERIVEAVEERLERVERLEKSVENVGRLADEYQDSYLAYLVTGGDESAVENLGHKLTSEDVADNWEVKEVSEIVSAKNGGTPKRSKKQYWGGNIEWLSSGEVKGKYTNSAEENINQSAIEESSAKLFPENSVLVAMYGKTRGQSTMITGQMSGNQAICCLTPSEKILPEYLLYFYKSIEDRLASKGRGAGQQNLNQSMVVEEMMPLPPIEEQREIVNDIEEYNFSKVEKSSSLLSEHFDEYKDSVLSHAFKGDLRRLTSSRSERVS